MLRSHPHTWWREHVRVPGFADEPPPFVEDGDGQRFGGEFGVDHAALSHLCWEKIGAVGKVEMPRLGWKSCWDGAMGLWIMADVVRDR